MAVLGIHTRTLPVSGEEIGRLIDGLAGREDRLWPGDRWPPMRLDRPLEVGASGGHGPIRYTVEAYEPGRWVRFRSTSGSRSIAPGSRSPITRRAPSRRKHGRW